MQLPIPARSARAFRDALEALNSRGVSYVIGGAFAMYNYTGTWRNTNDLDVYLERRYLLPAIQSLTDAGFRDYGEMAAGDREWIFHAMKNRVLVDLIWQPPNHLSPVDASFYSRGPQGVFLGVPVRFMPVDELVWAKVFTMNRHRCDWPDVFALIRQCPKSLDWRHLMDKMCEHWPVLFSFIVLFDWMYPGQERCIPDFVREELLRRKGRRVVEAGRLTREAVLDPWVYTRPVSP